MQDILEAVDQALQRAAVLDERCVAALGYDPVAGSERRGRAGSPAQQQRQHGECTSGALPSHAAPLAAPQADGPAASVVPAVTANKLGGESSSSSSSSDDSSSSSDDSSSSSSSDEDTSSSQGDRTQPGSGSFQETPHKSAASGLDGKVPIPVEKNGSSSSDSGGSSSDHTTSSSSSDEDTSTPEGDRTQPGSDSLPRAPLEAAASGLEDKPQIPPPPATAVPIDLSQETAAEEALPGSASLREAPQEPATAGVEVPIPVAPPPPPPPPAAAVDRPDRTPAAAALLPGSGSLGKAPLPPAASVLNGNVPTRVQDRLPDSPRPIARPTNIVHSSLPTGASSPAHPLRSLNQPNGSAVQPAETLVQAPDVASIPCVNSGGAAPPTAPIQRRQLAAEAPSSSDEDSKDSMPLAKRQRLLQSRQPASSPDVIVIADSDGDSEGQRSLPARAGAASASASAGGFNSKAQPQPERPAAQGAADTGGGALVDQEVVEIELDTSSECEEMEVLEEQGGLTAATAAVGAAGAAGAPAPGPSKKASAGGGFAGRPADSFTGRAREGFPPAAGRSTEPRRPGLGPASFSAPAGGGAASTRFTLPGTTGYGFSDPAVDRQFRRQFQAPVQRDSRQRHVSLQSAQGLKQKAKEILDEMVKPKLVESRKAEAAWRSAAMAWREKNKPTEQDIHRRQVQDSARASAAAAARTLHNPRLRAQGADAGDAGAMPGFSGGSFNHAGAPPPTPPHHQQQAVALPPRPHPNADEAELRAYFRQASAAKVAGVTSFVQVLRCFDVPCPDPARVKDAYRLAVRMYHPDSNSRERVWESGEAKVEAEEVMKVINERKPPTL